MSLLVRRAAPADLVPLARLHAACFPEDSWDATALAGVLAMYGADGRLAEEEAKPRGFLFALILETEAEILTLGVAPEARRRGIARALLKDLLRRTDAAGVAAVILEVAADNGAAFGLYRSCGFVTAGKRPAYYRRRDGNADAWLLRRDCPA
jgi:ribosomal-protein-alanine N-acetyltransferase